MSTQYVKAGLCLLGSGAVSLFLFYTITPSPSAATSLDVQQQLYQNQGILKKDIMESRRNTQQLMERLQQVSGGSSTNK